MLVNFHFVTLNSAYAYNPEEFDPNQGDYVEMPEIRWFEDAPKKGDVIDLYRNEGDPCPWIVADVVSYGGEFFFVTCTEDGTYPSYHPGWDEPGYYLDIVTDSALQPLTEEGYDSYFGNDPKRIPKAGWTEGDHRIAEVRLLKPDSCIPPWGYDFVALCIVAQEESAIAA